MCAFLWPLPPGPGAQGQAWSSPGCRMPSSEPGLSECPGAGLDLVLFCWEAELEECPPQPGSKGAPQSCSWQLQAMVWDSDGLELQPCCPVQTQPRWAGAPGSSSSCSFEVLLLRAGQLQLSSFSLTAQLHPDAAGYQVTHPSHPRCSQQCWALLCLPGRHPEQFQRNQLHFSAAAPGGFHKLNKHLRVIQQQPSRSTLPALDKLPAVGMP